VTDTDSVAYLCPRCRTNPIFKPGSFELRYKSYLVFEGTCVAGRHNYYMNATVAFRRADLNVIEYLTRVGLIGEQAYLLLGTPPIEGRSGLSSIFPIARAQSVYNRDS